MLEFPNKLLFFRQSSSPKKMFKCFLNDSYWLCLSQSKYEKTSLLQERGHQAQERAQAGAIRSEVKIKRWYFYHEVHEDLEEETFPLLYYPSLPSCSSCSSWL
jgi:hypothetical protein